MNNNDKNNNLKTVYDNNLKTAYNLYLNREIIQEELDKLLYNILFESTEAKEYKKNLSKYYKLDNFTFDTFKAQNFKIVDMMHVFTGTDENSKTKPKNTDIYSLTLSCNKIHPIYLDISNLKNAHQLYENLLKLYDDLDQANKKICDMIYLMIRKNEKLSEAIGKIYNLKLLTSISLFESKFDLTVLDDIIYINDYKGENVFSYSIGAIPKIEITELAKAFQEMQKTARIYEENLIFKIINSNEKLRNNIYALHGKKDGLFTEIDLKEFKIKEITDNEIIIVHIETTGERLIKFSLNEGETARKTTVRRKGM